MRDKKALKDLLALDRETLDMMSSKPFEPRFLDVIVSMDAPHLYSEENLAETRNIHQELQQQQQQQQQQQHSSQDAAAVVIPEKTEDNNMMVTAEMCPHSDQDLPEKKIENNNNIVTAERSAKSDQDLAEEEVVIHPAVTKKPRSEYNKRVTGKRCRRSENLVEEEVVINNPVSKKSRSTTSIELKMNAASPSPSSSSPNTCPSSSNLSPDTSPSSSNSNPSPSTSPFPSNLSPDTSPSSSNSNPSPSTSPSPSNLSPPPDHTTPTPPSSPNSLPNNPSLPASSNPAPPDMPIEFKNKILELNGTDIVFIMHKTLCETDVNPNNDRMSMPLTQIVCEFLTEAEKAALEERDRDRKKKFFVGLKVAVLDPYLREFTLKLKKWKMNTTSTYNLSSQWKRIVSSNDLKKNQELDIWSFRVQDKLHFIFNKL